MTRLCGLSFQTHQQDDFTGRHSQTHTFAHVKFWIIVVSGGSRLHCSGDPCILTLLHVANSLFVQKYCY